MSDCQNCLVRSSAICGALNAQELQEINKISHKRQLKRGETLVWEGDDPLIVANVLTGVMSLSTMLDNGKEQIVGLLFPSDFIGKPSGFTHTETVTALTPTEVCTFSHSDFSRFAQEHRNLEHKLLTRALSELEESRRWIAMLSQLDAKARLARLLILVSERISEWDCASRGETLNRFDLPFTRDMIANILGLTSETVSRQFSALKSDNILSTPSQRGILIHDRPALSRAAHVA